MLCFRKIMVNKKFVEKFFWGGYQDFQPKMFCLTVPKNLVGEPFCAVFQKNYGKQKVCGEIFLGRVSRFSTEIVLSHSAEKHRRGTLLCCVSEKSR